MTVCIRSVENITVCIRSVENMTVCIRSVENITYSENVAEAVHDTTAVTSSQGATCTHTY